MTAFALNTPVIASKVGSFPEFISNGFNGLLVLPANAEALATGIATALQNNYYQELKQNVIINNNEHTWEQSMAEVLTEYRQV